MKSRMESVRRQSAHQQLRAHVKSLQTKPEEHVLDSAEDDAQNRWVGDSRDEEAARGGMAGQAFQTGVDVMQHL